MSSPSVSIIVPCYNQGRYLGDALDSVLAQTHRDWECIIVNDGSDDDTHQVALAYVSRDPRFRYIEQQNRGLSGARNRGLCEIRGGYIQFLDSDDAISPKKLELQLKAAAEVTNFDVIYCDYYFTSPDDIAKRVEHNFPKPRFVMSRPLLDVASRWETELSIPVHSFLFDARIFTECGIRFTEGMPNHEDWDCWMRVFSLPIKLRYVRGEMAAYRLHPASMCRDHHRMWVGFTEAIISQRHLWRHDSEMQIILRKKLMETDVRYGYSRNALVALMLKVIHSSFFRRYFPWPGQRLVHRILGQRI